MARNNNNVPIAVGVGAIVWLYSPLGAPTRAKVAEWYAAQTKVVAGKKLPPSLGSTGSTGSTGVTVPGLVPLGPGAGRYQPATDYSWLSNPAAYPPGYYPPYNGVPTGRPNQRPGTRVASDPATGRPVGLLLHYLLRTKV